MTALFDRLPSEVISVVAEKLRDDLSSLRSLCLASTRFQFLAEQVLYQQVFFRAGYECVKLLKSIDARRERASVIHEIDARCLRQEQDGLESIGTILRRANNLRDLTLESPSCNYGYWRYDSDWKDLMACLLAPLIEAVQQRFPLDSTALTEHLPLQTLKKLTLHLNGDQSRFWNVKDAAAAIFVHPTLESLTISCAEIPDDATAKFDRYPKTPLKDLTMIECTMTYGGLHSILSKPSALRSLYLGEVHDHDVWDARGGICRLLEHDCTAFFTALSQQKESLENFEYRPHASSFSSDTSLVRSSGIPAGCEGFAVFDKLRSVSLLTYCPMFLGIIVDESLTPPTLKCVRVKIDFVDDFIVPADLQNDNEAKRIETWALRSQIRQLCEHLSRLKKLETVNLITANNYHNLNNDRYSHLIEAASRAFKPDVVNFSVTEESRRSSAFPPFLYGETPPLWTDIYDVSSGGWLVERRSARQRQVVSEFLGDNTTYCELPNDVDDDDGGLGLFD